MHTSHTFISELLARGSQPALIWYDVDERVELSGKVMAMHLSKIFYYLRDELGATESTTLVLDVPAHWKTTLWTLAGLFLDCQIVTDPDMGKLSAELSWSDIVLTATPGAHAHHATEVALALAPLALAWPHDLPDGCEDGVAGPLGYPDTLAMSDVPIVSLDITAPPPQSNHALAVGAHHQDELTQRCLGAICTHHSVVIFSPQSDVTSLVANERATIWGRIVGISKAM